MYELTKKLRDLEPYQPISGDYKIRLDANESFIRIDNKTIAKAFENTALNRYPDPYAVTATNAFAKLYNINPDMVTAGNGSDEIISIITACMFEKNDKVMCFSNDFSMYSFYQFLYELDVRILDKDDDLTINVDKAIEVINNEKIKAVIFSNPCNPTSLGLCKSEVERLIRGVNALVILDEAYMDFWDDSESLLPEIDKYDNLIVLKTCSKALAMAGVRLGFAVASPLITRALRAAKSPYNVNVLTQDLAAFLLSDITANKIRIEAVKKSIADLYTRIIEANFEFAEKIYPTNTNFVYIKTEKAKEIHSFMLENSIAIRCFNGYIRISCGSPEENIEVVETLKKFK